MTLGLGFDSSEYFQIYKKLFDLNKNF